MSLDEDRDRVFRLRDTSLCERLRDRSDFDCMPVGDFDADFDLDLLFLGTEGERERFL